MGVLAKENENTNSTVTPNSTLIWIGDARSVNDKTTDSKYCLSGIIYDTTSIPMSESDFKKMWCVNDANCDTLIQSNCNDDICYITQPTCGLLNPDSNGQCPTGFTYMNESYGCIKQTFLGYTATSQKYSDNSKVSFNKNPVIGYYFPYGGNSDPNCEPDANSKVICIESKNFMRPIEEPE